MQRNNRNFLVSKSLRASQKQQQASNHLFRNVFDTVVPQQLQVQGGDPADHSVDISKSGLNIGDKTLLPCQDMNIDSSFEIDLTLCERLFTQYSNALQTHYMYTQLTPNEQEQVLFALQMNIHASMIQQLLNSSRAHTKNQFSQLDSFKKLITQIPVQAQTIIKSLGTFKTQFGFAEPENVQNAIATYMCRLFAIAKEFNEKSVKRCMMTSGLTKNMQVFAKIESLTEHSHVVISDLGPIQKKQLALSLWNKIWCNDALFTGVDCYLPDPNDYDNMVKSLAQAGYDIGKATYNQDSKFGNTTLGKSLRAQFEKCRISDDDSLLTMFPVTFTTAGTTSTVHFCTTRLFDLDIDDAKTRLRLQCIVNEQQSSILTRLYDIYHGTAEFPFDHDNTSQTKQNHFLMSASSKVFISMGILNAIARAVAPLIGESLHCEQYSEIFRLTESFNPGDEGTDAQLVVEVSHDEMTTEQHVSKHSLCVADYFPVVTSSVTHNQFETTIGTLDPASIRAFFLSTRIKVAPKQKFDEK